jgi:hypothetical protein
MKCLHVMVLVATLGTAAGSAQAKPRERSQVLGDIHLTGVYSHGGSDELEDQNRSGLGLGGALAWEREADVNHFRIGASSDYFHYSDRDRGNRWTNQVQGSYGRDVSKRDTLSIVADYTSDLPALERSTADQLRLRGRIQHDAGPTRLRLTGGWRWRRYDDSGNSRGDGPTADLLYRYALDKTKAVGIVASYDGINADVDRRSYHRYSINPFARFAVDRRTDIEFGARYRRWTYFDRPVGDSVEKNTATSLEASVTRDLGNRWYAEIDGSAIRRRSNDNARDENITRAQLTIGKRLSIRL